jgi:chromosome segregation ATPase
LTHLMIGIRGRRGARGAVAAVVIAAALAAQGCGSSDEPASATDWADGVCSAITDWRESVEPALENVTSGDLSEGALEDAGNEIQDANDQLAEDLKDLDRPETASGQKAEDSIQKLSDDIEGGRDEIEAAVDDASDLGSTLEAVAVVSRTLSQLLTKVGTTIEEISQLDPGGEIEKAFSDSDACSSLRD